MNYFDQLSELYPDRKDILWYIQYPLQHHMYAYGNHCRISWENNKSFKWKLIRHSLITKFLRTKRPFKSGAIISSDYGKVNESLLKEGYAVYDLNCCLSVKSIVLLHDLEDIPFNKLLSKRTEEKILHVKDEIKIFLEKYRIRFLLLSDDTLPVSRLAITASKELNIPSGVFLHGLPAIYNLTDNFFTDYTFVWGNGIKQNYINAGCEKNIIVTGNPKYSGVHDLKGSHSEIVVISFCAGDVYDGAIDLIADRGLCVQYAYSVQSVLERAGVKHAILRVHPHENPEWYKKFVDTSFYSLDNNGLTETLSNAAYLVGPVSSVLVDAVSHNVPYYPFVITKNVNPHSWDDVPPFRKEDGLPVATSLFELQENISKNNYVKASHISSYYAHTFDVSKITECFIS